MGLKGLGAAVASVGVLAGSAWRVEQPSRTGAALAPILAQSSSDFQTALDTAAPGQTIVLQTGHVYEGPFYFRRKTGDGWITIQGDDGAKSLPGPGVRVTPADAASMPKLVASAQSVLIADPGAHHFRLVGLEIAPSPGVYLTDVVELGLTATTLDSVPHDFSFDRCYIHGDSAAGARRGIALNSANTEVINSYLADFKEVGFDSQALCGWNGPGPFTITNNYLEGAGENVMFGGADPTIPNLVPANITITRNHFEKPVSWRQDPNAPSSAPHWAVKNLLELKNAQHVVIDGNVFEYVWVDGQVGFAILFTPRNQDGHSPWSIVQDVTFTNNIVRHAGAGVDIIGTDDINTSGPLKQVRIANNLFADIGGSWGSGRLFQLLNGSTSVTIDHNTGSQTDVPLFGGDTTPHTSFVFTNNIVPHNLYGIIGSGTGPGQPSIDRYFPGSVIAGNVIAGANPSIYPPNNYYPPSFAGIGFVDAGAMNYRLTSASAFHGKATDGTDPGVNMDAVARSGTPTAIPRHPASGAALLVFWGAAALLVYTYIGYPGLVCLLARVEQHPVHTADGEPAVTLLVVAYNEEQQIAARIANLKALDYPAHLRKIVVVSDGSTDGTVARARAAGADVRVIDLPERRGKAAAFNAVLPALSTEIVILGDARQRFDTHAIRTLVSHFSDPMVGSVSGELFLAHNAVSQAGAQGAEVYWDYEKRLRWWESLFDSTVGVTGAIAAIRRSLFEPIPPDTVLDDVLIPLRIARRGYRVTFEPHARAYDRLSPVSRDEFGRKVRTLTGMFQLFAREPWLLVPWRNRLWIQTISHKALRLMLPAAFLLVFLSNVWLRHVPFYRIAFVGQLAFYGLAVVGALWGGLRRKVRLVVVPYAVCFLTAATIVAFIRFVRGRQRATWERTAYRSAPS